MKVNADTLIKCGFRHQQFPDGWFWFIQPETNEGALKLAQAMGFITDDLDELPDTIILQCEDSFKNWSYVYGPEVGTMTDEEAVDILRRLSA